MSVERLSFSQSFIPSTLRSSAAGDGSAPACLRHAPNPSPNRNRNLQPRKKFFWLPANRVPQNARRCLYAIELASTHAQRDRPPGSGVPLSAGAFFRARRPPPPHTSAKSKAPEGWRSPKRWRLCGDSTVGWGDVFCLVLGPGGAGGVRGRQTAQRALYAGGGAGAGGGGGAEEIRGAGRV